MYMYIDTLFPPCVYMLQPTISYGVRRGHRGFCHLVRHPAAIPIRSHHEHSLPTAVGCYVVSQNLKNPFYLGTGPSLVTTRYVDDCMFLLCFSKLPPLLPLAFTTSHILLCSHSSRIRHRHLAMKLLLWLTIRLLQFKCQKGSSYHHLFIDKHLSENKFQ